MAEAKEKKTITTKEPFILGIDEAGRGPVLGPMVYAAAYCAKSAVPQLNALGADDSKSLTEEQRDTLRTKLDNASFLHTSVTILSAEHLSTSMLRRNKYNLNLISHDTALQLVQSAIDAGANVTEVYVDTVGNPDSYAMKFRQMFPQLAKVVVEKKADATYRIVGAASIVAKTTRDRQLKGWEFPEEERSEGIVEGGDVGNRRVVFTEGRGSGYPSDPMTKKWMDSNCDSIFGFPSLVRFSWGTTKTILESNAVQVDWESEEEDGDEAPPPAKAARVKTKDIQSFFTGTTKTNGKSNSTKKRKKVTVQAIAPMVRSMSLKRTTTLL